MPDEDKTFSGFLVLDLRIDDVTCTHSIFTIFSCKQYDVTTKSNLHNRKTSISLKRKKIFQKGKRHSSVF